MSEVYLGRRNALFFICSKKILVILLITAMMIIEKIQFMKPPKNKRGSD
jgi:hypothetical protein